MVFYSFQRASNLQYYINVKINIQLNQKYKLLQIMSDLSSEQQCQSEHFHQWSILPKIYPFQQQKHIIKPIFPKCVVCKKSGKYKCPRCLIRYCSRQHYLTHNLKCTESFFQQNVQNQLKNTKVDDKTKEKTKNLLQQHQKQQVEDQTLDLISQQRLQTILTQLKQDKQVKLSHIQEQQLAKFLQNWVKQHQQKQFWEIEEGLAIFIQDESQVSIEQYNKSQHPDIILYRSLMKQRIKKVPSLSQHRKAIENNSRLSPNLIYHLYYLILAGSLLFRFYDAEYKIKEFKNHLNQMMKLIVPLKRNQKIHQLQSFKDVLGTIKYFLAQIQQGKSIEIWLQKSIQDSMNILKNKYYILQMLFRLQDCIISDLSLDNASQKAQFLVLKKCQFMQSYIIEQYRQENIKQLSKQISADNIEKIMH